MCTFLISIIVPYWIYTLAVADCCHIHFFFQLVVLKVNVNYRDYFSNLVSGTEYLVGNSIVHHSCSLFHKCFSKARLLVCCICCLTEDCGSKAAQTAIVSAPPVLLSDQRTNMVVTVCKILWPSAQEAFVLRLCANHSEPGEEQRFPC